MAVVLALTIGVSESPTAYALFLVASFTIVAVGQEFWRGTVARRRLAGGSIAAAFGSLVTRNRRRYGGYVVHVGLVLALFGVAASSSFQTSRDVRLSPGDSTEVGDYTVTYVKPTSVIDGAEQKLAFGAVLDVTRDGEHVTTLNPSRDYYSGAAADPNAPLQSFFEGETTSEVGRGPRASPRDLWSAMQPDLTTYDPIIQRADENYADRAGEAARLDPLGSAGAVGDRERPGSSWSSISRSATSRTRRPPRSASTSIRS